MKNFSIIVAVDKNLGIGRNNDLPWRIKADMAWFKKVTTTAPEGGTNGVIMGRKTWDSIPEKFRPLPERDNIVISRNPERIKAPHAADSLDAALELACKQCEKIFVIGGASIYEEAMKHPQLGELFITHIDRSFECDTFFPSLENCREVEVIQEREEEGLSFTIKRYVPRV